MAEPQTAQGLLYDSFDAIGAEPAERAARPTCPMRTGRWSTCSTVVLTASSAISTTTSRPNAASSANRDGSEVKSVELERLIRQGRTLIERRNGFEFFRDHAAELYRRAARDPRGVPAPDRWLTTAPLRPR